VTSFDPYKVLQVDSEAEAEVIEAAYRRLARKYHPDVAPGTEAEARMVALNRAWEVLRDPSRRAIVDEMRRTPARRAPSSAGRFDSSRMDRPEPGQPGTAAGPPPGWPGVARSDAIRQPSTGASREARWEARAADTGSPDWTSGRSTVGGGYDPATMRAPDGTGAAGPPPGNPSGSVIRFGRYDGWSLGEIARTDLEFLEWLDRMPIGRPYRSEIEALLRRAGRRSGAADAGERRGLFRRR
jgi:curved DNA-binding protein CbpA